MIIKIITLTVTGTWVIMRHFFYCPHSSRAGPLLPVAMALCRCWSRSATPAHRAKLTRCRFDPSLLILASFCCVNDDPILCYIWICFFLWDPSPPSKSLHSYIRDIRSPSSSACMKGASVLYLKYQKLDSAGKEKTSLKGLTSHVTHIPKQFVL